MPLVTLSEPIYLFQTIALALSIFNLVSFLWLACTVWLNGNRASLIARVGAVGLALSALFFFIHTLLISTPLTITAGLVTADFLWHLIWLPALGVPYIWFVIGLHYASLMNERWRHYRPLLLIASALLGLIVLMLLMLNQTTFTFAGTIRLLGYSDVISDVAVKITSPLVLLPVLFLCYVTFCAISIWFTPNRVIRLLRTLWYGFSGHLKHGSFLKRLSDAFWDDRVAADSLDEPELSWHLARPGLLFAALLMVSLTTTLGVLGVWSMLNWLKWRPVAHPSPPPATLTMIPFNLVLLDVFATGLVALIILLIGYAIVRHGILIERPLARRGFFEQWRGIVIVDTTFALFIALLVVLTRSNLGGLLIITCLATGAYALFTWSSYTAHDRYIALLGPFLQSTNARHWLNTDLQKTEQGMENLFFHLCNEVLVVQCARLIVLTGTVKRSFDYRWPADDRQMQAEEIATSLREQRLSTVHPVHPYSNYAYRIRMQWHNQPIICWVLPIYDEFGLVAKLYLGPRQDRSVFTDEDMDLAHACGQRILDTLRDHEAMLTVAGLLRRRIVDVKLLGAQQRRVLHDEILPQMHLALLRLETLRPRITAPQTDASPAEPALDEAIDMIAQAHRHLAAMMRATTTSAPHRLERDGMMHAIRTMIRQDFHEAFDEIAWNVPEEIATHIDEIVPPAIAELIFAAIQEALRNAARHARGSDVHRHLRLTVTAACDPHLEITVTDDGVGIISASSSTTGTGGGLLTHSALLAIAGGSLTVKSAPGEGVAVRILLPGEVLR
jgi:signal transduction histidine kinase